MADTDQNFRRIDDSTMGGIEVGSRKYPRIDWVIIGGESGPGARPMQDEWAQTLVDQCKAAGVAVFMKQMGGTRKPFRPIPDSMNVREWPNA